MTRLTYESAAAIIADLAADDGDLTTEYTRGQIEFAVNALGYEDDGTAEKERLIQMVGAAGEVFPAATLLYVVAFTPTEEGGAAIGGFDWFTTAKEAAERFAADVTGEDKDTYVHTLWTALTPRALYGRDAVVDYLDAGWGEPNEDVIGSVYRL